MLGFRVQGSGRELKNTKASSLHPRKFELAECTIVRFSGFMCQYYGIWCHDAAHWGHIHICMYACMHACMHACLSVCLSVCLYVCMYVYMHIYIYICIHHIVYYVTYYIYIYIICVYVYHTYKLE